MDRYLLFGWEVKVIDGVGWVACDFGVGVRQSVGWDVGEMKYVNIKQLDNSLSEEEDVH